VDVFLFLSDLKLMKSTSLAAKRTEEIDWKLDPAEKESEESKSLCNEHNGGEARILCFGF